jgi:hypothetical protein
MNKKGSEEAEASLPDNSKIIGDLTRAVEQLLTRDKKPQELEGIIAEARQLARQWKHNKRALFEGYYDNSLIQLLAALVLALKQYYELLEPVLRRFPDEFKRLVYANSDEFIKSLLGADYSMLAPKLQELVDALRPQPLSPKQKSKRKFDQKRWRRGNVGIEWDFGGAKEEWLRKSTLFPSDPTCKAIAAPTSPLVDPKSGLTKFLMPTCLDDIFVGSDVSMVTLQDLFQMERHQLLKKHYERFKKQLPCVKRGRYDYHAVVEILRALVSERRKSRKPKGRRPRPGLSKPDVRTRVLSGIEVRIDSFPGIRQDIAQAFLAVVRRYSPGSGKK